MSANCQNYLSSFSQIATFRDLDCSRRGQKTLQQIIFRLNCSFKNVPCLPERRWPYWSNLSFSSFKDDTLWLQTAVWSGDFHMEIKLRESKESPEFSRRRWKHNFSAPRPPRASSLLCVLFWTLKAWPRSGVGVRVGGPIKGQPLTSECVLWSEPAVCRTPNGGRGWCSCIPPRSEHVRLRDGERLWEGRKKENNPSPHSC